MKQELIKLIQTAIKQIFGVSAQKPRSGQIVITTNGRIWMKRFQIDEATIEDSFRHGEEIEEGLIFRKYMNYWIKLRYVETETPWHKNIKSEKRYLITSCWKGEKR